MATDAVSIPQARASATPPVASRARRLPRVTRRRLSALAAVIVGVVLVGGMLFLRSWPPLATVMSASMAPTIKTGDVVVLQHLGRPAHVGDIIEVNVPDEARSRYGYPPVVIHRVVSIARNGQIQTKGDARPGKDPFTVSRHAVTARVVATIPAAGRLFAFLLSPLGLLWLAGGAALLVAMPLLESRREQHEREQHSVDELHSELRSISADLAELREIARRGEREADERIAESGKLEAEVVAPAVEVVPVPEPVAEPESESEPAPELRLELVHVKRRTGGLVGAVERHARSLSSRYR
jgi:signal peptidase I